MDQVPKICLWCSHSFIKYWQNFDVPDASLDPLDSPLVGRKSPIGGDNEASWGVRMLEVESKPWKVQSHERCKAMLSSSKEDGNEDWDNSWSEVVRSSEYI